MTFKKSAETSSFSYNADTPNNIGIALKLEGKPDEAAAAFREAIAINPNDARAHYNLGCVLRDQERTEESLISFRRATDLDPGNLSAKHIIAALTGQTTETAPREFVKDLFDQYSAKFDHHLVRKLEYHAPILLRQAFQFFLNDDLHFKNAIDLGCGTGLAGAEFRRMAGRLTGIDISPNMIKEARNKNIYDVLKLGDIIAFLNNTEEKYDLFISADVFVYIGNLKPVFYSVRDRSLRGAYFIFSTEISHKNDYILRQTGRYAHSRAYIRSIAEAHGFAVEKNWPAVLRKENGRAVRGEISVLQKSS